MKKVKVIFSKPKGKKFPVIAWIIQAFMGTKYSHVCYGFHSDSLDRDIIYEAVGSGLRFIGQKLWGAHAEVVVSYEIEVCPEVYKEMMQTCVDFAGGDYGYKQNLGVIIAHYCKLDSNPFPKDQNCSETLARLLKNAGYEFDKNLNLITPADIETSIINKQNETNREVQAQNLRSTVAGI